MSYRTNNVGCIIVANNSVTSDGRVLDYIALAEKNAELIRARLSVPVSLLTSDANATGNFDSIIHVTARAPSKRALIMGEEDIVYDWHNDYRIDTFYHTPYDRTLVVDADYIVLSNKLKLWLDSDLPFLIFDSAKDALRKDAYKDSHFPDASIRRYWATAFCFNKDAEPIFEAAKMVRENYEMYALMVGLPTKPFRNDLAFSIACHLLDPRIDCLPSAEKNPLPLFNLIPSATIKISNHRLFLYSSTSTCSFNFWYNIDLHVLNKSLAVDKEYREELFENIKGLEW